MVGGLVILKVIEWVFGLVHLMVLLSVFRTVSGLVNRLAILMVFVLALPMVILSETP